MRSPRLHKSSLYVGLVVGTLLVLIMIPGRIVRGQPSTSMTFEHGWPFTYLRREAKGRAPAQPFIMYRSWRDDVAERPMWGVPWLATANWRLWEATVHDSVLGHETAHWDFRGGILVVDFAVAMLVLVGTVAAWEVRRRRRPSLFSFSLADVLIAGACVSGVLAWTVHLDRDHRREYELESRSLDDLDSCWFGQDESCVAPVWVRSLIGERLLPEFTWRIHTINVNADDQVDYAQLVVQLSEFAYLHRINFDDIEREPEFRLSWLSELNNVDTFDFYSGWCSDQRRIDELAQLGQLQKIVIWGKGDVDPKHLAELETALPHCQIVDFDDDW